MFSEVQLPIQLPATRTPEEEKVGLPGDLLSAIGTHAASCSGGRGPTRAPGAEPVSGTPRLCQNAPLWEHSGIAQLGDLEGFMSDEETGTALELGAAQKVLLLSV